jgi:hypothetical protein
MPTIAQKERIVEIIKNDAAARFRYKTETGETCALGGLAEAAGFIFDDDFRLAYNEQAIDFYDRDPDFFNLISLLTTTYGLSEPQLATIQAINDNNEDPAKRHQALITYVMGL